jgi:hypothetical protein
LPTQPTSILRFVCIALLACAVLVPVSKADPVTYTFSGKAFDGLNVAFQYTSSSGFVSPDSFDTLFRSDLTSCTNCGLLPFVPVVQFEPQIPFLGDLLAFDDKFGVVSLFGFQGGAFDNYGSYQAYGLFNSGTLTVSGTGVKTPEPGALGFLACGLALLAGFASRKRLGSLAAARG